MRNYRRAARDLTLSLALLLLTTNAAKSQTDATRIYGIEDSGVLTPPLRAALGQHDGAALQELIDYLKAVNVHSWQGLRASGRLTNTNLDAALPEQATFIISQDDKFRLDATTSAGIRSTRIAGSIGATMDPDGSLSRIPEATSRLGLAIFPQLLSASFPSSDTSSLIDRGTVELNGTRYHRITVSEALADVDHPNPSPNRMVVVDLYFDSTSHLLIKSAAQVQLDQTHRTRFVQVLTYGDYRKVGDALFAFQLHQSLNGQPQWTLQLSDIELGPDQTSSDFFFSKERP